MKIQFGPDEREAIEKVEQDGVKHVHLPHGVVEAEIESWQEFQREFEQKKGEKDEIT